MPPIADDGLVLGAARREERGDRVSTTGSGTLDVSFLREGLIDELHLLVHTIVVGAGKRLFDDGAQVSLRVIDSKTFSTGVLYLTYTRADS